MSVQSIVTATPLPADENRNQSLCHILTNIVTGKDTVVVEAQHVQYTPRFLASASLLYNPYVWLPVSASCLCNKFLGL